MNLKRLESELALLLDKNQKVLKYTLEPTW